MTEAQQSHLDNIQQLLIDTKRRLNEAADSGNIAEIAAYQIKSLPLADFWMRPHEHEKTIWRHDH